ncbi:hypothetical protein ACTHAM_002355 [Cellulomonas soli]|uniref:phage tail tube protein n=1 Tax=Cellulomonas soli TaxID=931535 RepID=UPI003F8708EE
MTPSLPATERFFQPEISECIFLPAIAAATLVPTRPEITAGTRLTDEIAGLSGWTISSAMITTPDYGRRFISQIAARTNAEQSSITFYADLGGDDVRKVLPRGTKGFILWADHGDEVDLPADIFKIEVTSVGKLRSVGDQAFQVTVTFAITKEPSEDVSLPAAA